MHVIKVTVPDEFKKRFPKVNWDSIAERALREEYRRLSALKMLDKLFSGSELTEEDCLKLGKKVNRGLRKRHSS